MDAANAVAREVELTIAKVNRSLSAAKLPLFFLFFMGLVWCIETYRDQKEELKAYLNIRQELDLANAAVREYTARIEKMVKKGGKWLVT